MRLTDYNSVFGFDLGGYTFESDMFEYLDTMAALLPGATDNVRSAVIDEVRGTLDWEQADFEAGYMLDTDYTLATESDPEVSGLAIPYDVTGTTWAAATDDVIA